MALFGRPKKKTRGRIEIRKRQDGRFSVSLPSEGGRRYIVASETKARILENAELTINPNLDVLWMTPVDEPSRGPSTR